ncbi:MAG: hypothetical protein FJ023_01865 [Chloroflexi bacterium]|nr:hypothetical protein [Chloroflexota bacterium]
MFEISEPIKAAVNTLIAALPALAVLLFSLSEARKRRLNSLESWAVYLVFWGFFLFASWENFRIRITDKYTLCLWLQGWLVPILVGLVITSVSIVVNWVENKKR